MRRLPATRWLGVGLVALLLTLAAPGASAATPQTHPHPGLVRARRRAVQRRGFGVAHSNTPIVFAGADPRLARPEFLRTNATLVTQKVNLPGMVEDILQLRPDTTHIAVVFGASSIEKFWAGECRREFQPFADRVAFSFLDDLTLDQMRGIVQFRQPNFWELYRWRVVAVLLFGLLQTALIVGLLVSRAERRRAEAAAHDLSQRLIRAHEEERARLARELHDDLTQRLALLAIAVGRVEHGTAEASPAETAREVREGLVRLSEEVHALAYRLHPAILEDLGLTEALTAEGERFTWREAVPVAVQWRDLPEPLPGAPG